MSNPWENMSRRKAVVVIGSGIGSLVFAACGFKIVPIDYGATATPSNGGSPGIRPAQAEATATTAPEKAKYELSAGIELPANWPQTREEALTAMGLTGATADNILPKIDANNKWTGQWVVEGFNLQTGVHFDTTSGRYVNTSGKILTNDVDIFAFRNGTDYAQPKLFSVKLQTADSIMFARTGGSAPADKRNSSYYIGDNSTVDTIEQAALIPEQAGCDQNVEAWRAAIQETQQNGDVIKGDVRIFHVKNGNKHFVDGSMLRALAKTDFNVAEFINNVPPEYPLTTAEMGKATNTEPSKWFLENSSGVYQREGFPFKPGVTYNARTGLHYNQNGAVVNDPNGIFDYSHWDKSSWPKTVKLLNNPYVFMVVRKGGEGNPKNTSLFAIANGTTVGDTSQGPGFEQIGVVPTVVNGCVLQTADVTRSAMSDAAAQTANDTTITVKIVN